MKILGRWNWYFPGFLEFLPHIDFEAGGEPTERANGGAASADTEGATSQVSR
jgi:hypothetical protein